jgi:hypothetical protein
MAASLNSHRRLLRCGKASFGFLVGKDSDALAPGPHHPQGSITATVSKGDITARFTHIALVPALPVADPIVIATVGSAKHSVAATIVNATSTSFDINVACAHCAFAAGDKVTITWLAFARTWYGDLVNQGAVTGSTITGACDTLLVVSMRLLLLLVLLLLLLLLVLLVFLLLLLHSALMQALTGLHAQAPSSTRCGKFSVPTTPRRSSASSRPAALTRLW